MEYRDSIIKTLELLQSNMVVDGPDWKEVEALKEMAKKEQNPTVLFGMYQSLREIVAKELTGKEAAPFKVRAPDGTIVEHQTLEEARSAPLYKRRRRDGKSRTDSETPRVQKKV